MASALPIPVAPRLKTRWFRPDAAAGAGIQASAAAFVVWRLARHALDRTRHAGFAVEVGPPYFRFLREVLCFLVAVADRIAYARLAPAQRAEFTGALVHHLARILQDSEDDLLGAAPAGRPGSGERFIDLVNERATQYAEFGADPGAAAGAFQPDFAFLRYLGVCLEPTLAPADRRWILDQVMAIDAPDVVAMLRQSLADLFEPGARRARPAALSGD